MSGGIVYPFIDCRTRPSTMTDSIHSLDSDVHRIAGYPGPPGRLHKGHAIVAHNSSIPTKYQTVVISNAARHSGFNSHAKRFQYQMEESLNPGPAAYDVKKEDFVNKSPSISKRGTGGFASKDKRKAMRAPGTTNPAANYYSLPSMMRTHRDFNVAPSTSSFSQPIAVSREKRQDRPAPNEYDVLRAHVGKENHVSAGAAFKSHTRREVMENKEAQMHPGPGQYEVVEADRTRRPNEKTPFSSFKSTSNRMMKPPSAKAPGPGAYRPGEPITEEVKRVLMPKKHYLCLSAPALQLPPSPASPGPAAYDLVNYEDSKHFMSGSVFLSNTSRWATGGAVNAIRSKLPGPAHYHPGDPFHRQSFHFNSTTKWV